MLTVMMFMTACAGHSRASEKRVGALVQVLGAGAICLTAGITYIYYRLKDKTKVIDSDSEHLPKGEGGIQLEDLFLNVGLLESNISDFLETNNDEKNDGKNNKGHFAKIKEKNNQISNYVSSTLAKVESINIEELKELIKQAIQNGDNKLIQATNYYSIDYGDLLKETKSLIGDLYDEVDYLLSYCNSLKGIFANTTELTTNEDKDKLKSDLNDYFDDTTYYKGIANQV